MMLMFAKEDKPNTSSSWVEAGLQCGTFRAAPDKARKPKHPCSTRHQSKGTHSKCSAA